MASAGIRSSSVSSGIGLIFHMIILYRTELETAHLPAVCEEAAQRVNQGDKRRFDIPIVYKSMQVQRSKSLLWPLLQGGAAFGSSTRTCRGWLLHGTCRPAPLKMNQIVAMVSMGLNLDSDRCGNGQIDNP